MSRRFFNTAGPCIERMHYLIPPESRLPTAPRLVEQLGYFVVHAPRQTGKTTALLALARNLTASGRYAAVMFSCENGEPAGENYGAAQRAILIELQLSAAHQLPPALRPPDIELTGDEGQLRRFLEAWCQQCPLPVVLFFDEIDALRGASLLTVLRQLRAGYPSRPEKFPASVALCGLRDVRDYKAASGGDPSRLGTSSPFNIKLESLRIGNFDEDEMRALYAQHTTETRQVFSEHALAAAWEVTGGQPWLVNAVAREITEKMAVPESDTITAAHVDEAKERLILARATHLDSLVAKLHQPRVKRIVQALIGGELMSGDASYNDDISYVRDLGLVAEKWPLRIANPIYREVIVRVLSGSVEDNITADPRSFVLPDGSLDFRKLLEEFAAFWREHGDVLTNGLSYHEVAPQLVLMAFLQRIVNGGGYIDREYGVGRGRIDLLVRWPYRDKDGSRLVQREALEIKVWRDKVADPLSRGLTQLDGYLDRLGLDAGTLAIFDRREAAEPIDARTRFDEQLTPAGRSVTLLRG